MAECRTHCWHSVIPPCPTPEHCQCRWHGEIVGRRCCRCRTFRRWSPEAGAIADDEANRVLRLVESREPVQEVGNG